MTSCTGCRFLVHARNIDVCRATDAVESRRNPWSGRQEMIYHFRPTLSEMRGEGGACGPERRLYQPSLWERLARKLRKRT